MNDNLRRESRSQDIYYFDESTKRVQNVFHVTSACSGGSSIRPCLLLKDSMSWSDKKTNSVHNITNWCQNRDDKKMVHWEHKGCDLNLKSRFICSASMKKLMSVPNTWPELRLRIFVHSFLNKRITSMIPKHWCLSKLLLKTMMHLCRNMWSPQCCIIAWSHLRWWHDVPFRHGYNLCEFWCYVWVSISLALCVAWYCVRPGTT